ncbi:probable mediator of RNA polymerase II transcription subunit 26b isoform X2 [Neltuma alba]|uniref:probable mediator of RNA polymerase II transcription subunit 26b isoform X2 n=1 Tax=Neltuma alba TaxID=207710 RepID=UPI0010A2D3A6|nr:probable mediator of RNA polymerase II transcription subunit 26b isoform X2 [Prosopis alba]XP_028798158.1 probable mediator of RNA polymerase II transcription subunit 26b isoform X2 [Prosopis alba]
MKSRSLDYWRSYFRTANSDIFDIIDHAIMVAASDCPKEFRLRRDRIAERLFSCRMTRCLGCERVELAVSGVDQEYDGGCKSGFDRDGAEVEAGASKESKAHSSRDDRGDMNMNHVSNFSYGEAEALTDEIEEESQLVGETLRIKEILHNCEEESDSEIFESLRRLQLMELTVDLLKATEIGKAVNPFRKHGSMEIRQLARTLIDGWKEMVDEWVNATTTNAGSEGTPDSVNPSVVDEEEEEGLPSPPMDEGAFFAAQTASMELSQFFDGMDDDGNPRQSGEFIKNRENGRRPALDNQNIVKRKPQASDGAEAMVRDSRNQQAKKNEAVAKLNKSATVGSGPGRPLKSSMQRRENMEPRMLQKMDRSGVPKRPLAGPQDSKCADDTSVQMKLEATKRKLQESYQQAEIAKKQRTIQVMELHDLPKQGGIGHRATHFKPMKHQNRNWAQGRR